MPRPAQKSGAVVTHSMAAAHRAPRPPSAARQIAPRIIGRTFCRVFVLFLALVFTP
jgi:hypothetical protein